MAGPTTRVLALLELLQARGQLSGAELAERLGVDRRTVRRYISVLEDMPRRFDPYGLVFWAGNWYAGGFCHLRQALRSFRLDRLSDIAQSDESFVRPTHFDAARHLQESLYSAKWRYPVSVLLQTEMNTVTSYMSRETTCTIDIEGMFEQQENGVRLTTSTDSYHWFAWWLAQLPFGFVIQSPDDLKAALNEHIQRLIAAV